MKTQLEQVLVHCLHGREIVIWGVPTRSLIRALRGYSYRVIDSDAVNPGQHYVLAVSWADRDDFMLDEQSKVFKYPFDCYTFEDQGGGLPFAWECYGVPIGRETYFGQGYVQGCQFGYLESIGHFTSINHTALVACDHQHNMVFTSDDLPELFTEENMDLYKSRKLIDPKHPGGIGKYRLIIGSDVYIGAHSFINASKVTSIGDGALIGAGAVVLDNVPPYAVVVGVPARIIRYRFEPEMIETLLRVKWWEWSIEEINTHADALINPEVFMQRFGR